jgi:hypothetical protein
MLLLCVVCFVEDKEVYSGHGDEAASETVEEYLGSADHNHVFAELLIPVFFRLRHAFHMAHELGNWVGSEVAAKDGMLLNTEGDLFYQKEGNFLGFSDGSSFQLMFEVMS